MRNSLTTGVRALTNAEIDEVSGGFLILSVSMVAAAREAVKAVIEPCALVKAYVK